MSQSDTVFGGVNLEISPIYNSPFLMAEKLYDEIIIKLR